MVHKHFRKQLSNFLDQSKQFLWVCNGGACVHAGVQRAKVMQAREKVHHDRSPKGQGLEREVKGLRQANDISKLTKAFFAQADLDRPLRS